MIRRPLGLAILASALALPVGQASAQSWVGLPVCTLGAYQVCLSVDNISWDAGTNRLTFRVTNLAPTYGTTHWITALGFYHAGTAWTGTASLVAVNGSTNLGGWKSVPPSNTEIINNPGGVLELGVDRNGINGGIANGQAVTFTVQLSSQFVFDPSTELRWHSQSVAYRDSDISVKCDTGWSDGGQSYPGCNVVPEPITMALLGTGLAGLGGAGFLRRRRRGVDVTDA